MVSGGRAAATAPAGPQKRIGTTEIKVIGLRRKIAERLAAASREIPHFSYVEEVDMTALESLRGHLNSTKGTDEPKLTPLAFLGLAVVRVLREFPQCNAHYDSERNVLIRHEAVHLGVATQTGDGLKVPVVRHAEARTLDDLAAEIRRVSTAARDNSASRDELTGSTITITSLGKLGGIASTPIINQPEVGIIGVNKMVNRPMVIDGRVEVRTMMNLSSSFDHRFVDGYDAAAMVQALKELLEQPALIFMPL
jgi:2-oxoisovalerate dehydrogenase E2 component (dihydrolipoyl transacylase)